MTKARKHSAYYSAGFCGEFQPRRQPITLLYWLTSYPSSWNSSLFFVYIMPWC